MQGFIADSYMDLQSARLMTIHAAEKVDQGRSPGPHRNLGHQGVRAGGLHRVVDRAIQVWGAAGVTNDLPLAQMYLTARTSSAWPTVPTRCTAS
jgi:acyl-CoA dehydrogenase